MAGQKLRLLYEEVPFHAETAHFDVPLSNVTRQFQLSKYPYTEKAHYIVLIRHILREIEYLDIKYVLHNKILFF